MKDDKAKASKLLKELEELKTSIYKHLKNDNQDFDYWLGYRSTIDNYLGQVNVCCFNLELEFDFLKELLLQELGLHFQHYYSSSENMEYYEGKMDAYIKIRGIIEPRS